MDYYDRQYPGVLSNATNAKRVRLLVGDRTNATLALAESQRMAAEIRRRGYEVLFNQTEGTHNGPWFRRYLNELAPKMFQ